MRDPQSTYSTESNDLKANIGSAWVLQATFVARLEKELAVAKSVESYLRRAREQVKKIE